MIQLFGGQGIGDRLMFDALARSLSNVKQIGSIAVITDPKDENAATFYKEFNFMPLKADRLFLPMTEVQLLIASRFK